MVSPRDFNQDRRDAAHAAITRSPSRRWTVGALAFEITKVAQTEHGDNRAPVLAADLRVTRRGETVFDDRIVMPNPATQVRNEDGSLTEDPQRALQITLEQIASQYTRGFTQPRRMRIGDSDHFFGDILAVRSNAGDGVVVSGNGVGSTSWSSIRSGSAALSADDNDASETINARTAGSTYIATEAFFDYDTSSIGASSTINSYTFTLYGTGTAENNADSQTIECRVFNWGGTLTTADWVTGANWSSNTLFANLSLGSWAQTNNTANNFTSQGASASIEKAGTTSLVVGLNRLSSATAPTGINDFVTYFADNTGTTSDPLLTVDYTPGDSTGTIVASLQAALFSGTGAQIQTGTMAATLQAATAALTGAQAQSGSVAATMQAATFTGSGTQDGGASGTLASTLQPATASLTGFMVPSGAITSTLQAATFSGTGAQAQSGSIAATLQAALFSGTGTQTQTGSIAATMQPATFSGAGSQIFTGSLAGALQPATAAFVGVMQPSGVIAVTMQPALFTGTAQQIYLGAMAATMQRALFSGTGAHIQTGTMAAVMQYLLFTGLGVFQHQDASSLLEDMHAYGSTLSDAHAFNSLLEDAHAFAAVLSALSAYGSIMVDARTYGGSLSDE